MYSDIDEARSELVRRRNDRELHQRVLEFLGGDIPHGVFDSEQPVATLHRDVARGAEEDHQFALMALNGGFVPFWPEYVEERFTARNPDKLALCLLPIGQLHQHVKKVKIVADIPSLEKMRICDIMSHIVDPETEAALSIVDVHHRIRQKTMPAAYATNFVDYSSWLQKQALRNGWVGRRNMAVYYYASLLALHVCHGVMFEDFHAGPNAAVLEAFVSKVVEPAIRRVVAAVGLRPIIVRLPWCDGYDVFPAAAHELLTANTTYKSIGARTAGRERTAAHVLLDAPLAVGPWPGHGNRGVYFVE